MGCVLPPSLCGRPRLNFVGHPAKTGGRSKRVGECQEACPESAKKSSRLTLAVFLGGVREIRSRSSHPCSSSPTHRPPPLRGLALWSLYPCSCGSPWLAHTLVCTKSSLSHMLSRLPSIIRVSAEASLILPCRACASCIATRTHGTASWFNVTGCWGSQSSLLHL